jgi:hypothetical protein
MIFQKQITEILMIRSLVVDRSLTIRDGEWRRAWKRPHLDPAKTLLEQDEVSASLTAIDPEKIVLEPVSPELWTEERPDLGAMVCMFGYEHIIHVADKLRRVRLDGCIMLSIFNAKAFPTSWIPILEAGGRIHFDGEIVGWKSYVYTPVLGMWQGDINCELARVDSILRKEKDFSATLAEEGAGLKYEFVHCPL